MNRFIFLLLISLVYTHTGYSQQRQLWKTDVGNFYVKYEGRGSWQDAKNKSNSGWRLPTGKEFNSILRKTALGNPCWKDLLNDGWEPEVVDDLYFWTSIDKSETWSCNQCALVVLFGSESAGNPRFRIMEKNFSTLGIILVKKLK
ncbi:hypothetical protein [Gaetbulibacter jejuensis]|uniref:hypothetical protein n=1 Tax=Gaetbulibacter jejuensis TaxID=584607 RepID=UPI003008C4AD